MFHVHDIDNLITVVIAAACGGMLGLEREFAGKPAGLRTHIFVCAGSALMMILGQEIVDQFQRQETDSAISTDPIRILQAIVLGISFLGAGTIVHQKHEQVEGLTTAATIFVTAGIGVAVAADRLSFALTLTVLATVVLFLLKGIEDAIANLNRKRGENNRQ
ncbi:MgtC/SapB family protein [Aporhodopirellula aestuarii]|nr:MgtC/SapB family protein [Aporhodopirellula aestuarii]